MPRKFIKKILPEHRTLVENRWLQPFRALLHDPAVLGISRRAVARGLGVGMFWAFMPVPLQSFFATATCIWLRVNVPVAIVACWITNPFTAVPIVYAASRIGGLLLGPQPIPETAPEALAAQYPVDSLGGLWHQLLSMGEAFLLGSLVLAVGSAALTYLLVNTFWLWSVRRSFARRRLNRPPTGPMPRP